MLIKDGEVIKVVQITNPIRDEFQTYRSPTAEGMLLEAAMVLQALEMNDFYNISNPKQNKVNVTINTDALTATISATIPVKIQRDSIGKIELTAAQYLVTPGERAVQNPPDLPQIKLPTTG